MNHPNQKNFRHHTRAILLAAVEPLTSTSQSQSLPIFHSRKFGPRALLKRLFPAVAVAAFFAGHPAQAATLDQWKGAGTSTAWALAGNWVGGTPANDLTTNIALFDSTAYSFQPTTGAVSIAGIQDGDGTVSTGALTITGNAAFKVGGSGILMMANSGALTLNTGVVIGASQNWENDSSSLFTVGATVTNVASTPFTLTLNGSGVGGTTFNGIMANGATGGTLSLTVNTTNGGVTTLHGANTFTGATSINGGIVNYTNLTAFGKNSAITVASGATAQVSGGIASTGVTTLTISGNGATGATGALENVSGANSATMPVVLAANSTISSDAGSLTLSGGVTGAFNLTLASQSSGNGTITFSTGAVNNAGTITNSGIGSGATTISSIGSNVTGVFENSANSSLVLSGQNTFSGGTTLTSGTLKVTASTTVTTGALVSGPVGIGTLVLSGGTLTDDATARTLANNVSITASTVFASGNATGITLGDTHLTTPATITLNSTPTLTVNNALTIQSVIQNGSGNSFTKDGAGTLILSGVNTFTGGLTLASGTLSLTSTTALGTGTLVINGGVITNGAGGGVTNANNNAQTWNADFSYVGAASRQLNLGTGAVSLGTTAGTTRTVTVTTPLSSVGTAGLTVGGVISNGATANTIIKAGIGSLGFGNKANTFSNLIVTGGVVTYASTTALVSTDTPFGTGTIQLGAGTTISFLFPSDTSNNLGTAIELTGNATLQGANGNGRNTTFSGVISEDATPRTLALVQDSASATGIGTILELNNTNTYTGGTTFDFSSSAGTASVRAVVLANAVNALGGGAAGTGGAFTFTGSGVGTTSLGVVGVLRLGADQAIAGLASANTGGTTFVEGNSAGTTRTLTINTAGSSTYSGAIGVSTTDAGGNNIAVVKSGIGSQTFSGTNTYTGNTTIGSGTLALASATSNNNIGSSTKIITGTAAASTAVLDVTGISTTGGFQVQSGQTVSGYGTVNGATEVLGGGGIAPGGIGATSGGTLSVTGNVTFDSGSTFSIRVGVGVGNNDLLAINGAATLGGTLSLGTFSTPDQTQYTLLTTSGLLTGTFATISGTPSGYTVNYHSNSVTLDLSGVTATSTTYNLASSATTTKIFTSGSTAISSTITNVGTGTADTLDYSGLGASATGGSVTGSGSSGGPLANNGGSGTNSGQTYTAGATSGTFTVTPVGTGTNHTLGTSANLGSTSTATVSVYDQALLTTGTTGATQGTAANLSLTNAASTGGASGQRAGVTVTGVSASNGTAGDNTNNFSTPTITSNPVADAHGSSTTAIVATAGVAAKRLNGTYTETVTGTTHYTDSTLNGQQSVASQTWTVTAGVSGNTSTGRADTYSANILNGQKYSGFSLSSNITSPTHDATTAGIANSAVSTATGSTNLTMSFDKSPNGVENDNTNRKSDILSLGGIAAVTGTGYHGVTLTDEYVLTMSYDASVLGPVYIGWYDSTLNQYVNAIAGNSTVGGGEGITSGGPGNGNYQGNVAYDGTDLTLGDYGYSNGVAWVVVDHGAIGGGSAEFAVIPEPGTWGMILSGFGMLIGFQRLRKRRVGI